MGLLRLASFGIFHPGQRVSTVQFGAEPKDLLRGFDAGYDRFERRLSERTAREYRDTKQAIELQEGLTSQLDPSANLLDNPGQETGLKDRRGNAYLRWNGNGFLTRNVLPENVDKDLRGEQRHFGLYLNNTLFLDEFYILDEHKKPIRAQHRKEKSEGIEGTSYHYPIGSGTTEDSTGSSFVRNNTHLIREKMKVELEFSNDSMVSKTYTIVLGTRFSDLSEARSGKPEPRIQRMFSRPTVFRSIGKLEAIVYKPVSQQVGNSLKGEEYTENLLALQLQVKNSNPQQVYYEIRSSNDEPTRLLVEVRIAPKASGTLTLDLIPSSLSAESEGRETEVNAPFFTDATWTEKAGSIVPMDPISPYSAIWKTAEKDIRNLLIEVPCGDKTYLYPGAGFPNYMAPFGRDGILLARQTLNFMPFLAENVLRVLAHYQGKNDAGGTEEEPGKVMHELRNGSLSDMGVLPFSPSYSTMDATPLFVMLMDEYVRRTNDTRLLADLWPNLEAALEWMEDNIRNNRGTGLQGFLSQRESTNPDEFPNISWMDSAGAFEVKMGKDGKLYNPDYPIAPAEVQAYFYGARRAAATLYRLKSKQVQNSAEQRRLETLAQEQDKKALQLKNQFNRKYWMPDRHFVAKALDRHGKPVESLGSNGAHALLTGIVDDDKARMMATRIQLPEILYAPYAKKRNAAKRMVERNMEAFLQDGRVTAGMVDRIAKMVSIPATFADLMEAASRQSSTVQRQHILEETRTRLSCILAQSGITDREVIAQAIRNLTETDLLTGWGMPTVARSEWAHNPVSYHNGTVWPHDNSMIAAGAKHSGQDELAQVITDQILDAATTFEESRLPELYAGFYREGDDRAIVNYPHTNSPQAWAAGTPFMLLTSMLGMEIDGQTKTVRFKRPRLPANLSAVTLKGIPITDGIKKDFHIRRVEDRSARFDGEVRVVVQGDASGVGIQVENSIP